MHARQCIHYWMVYDGPILALTKFIPSEVLRLVCVCGIVILTF